MPRSRKLSPTPVAASQIDLAQLSNPPLPVELWLSIFNGFSYSELHKARSINRSFSQWVLCGQYDRVLFRSPSVAPEEVARLLRDSAGRRLAFHPLLRHLVLGDAPWTSWQENATWPPITTITSLGIDLPETRAYALPASKDSAQCITVERVLRTFERILVERVYLPGNIDRDAVVWVRAYERATGRISWRGEYTSPLIISQAFEPWDGRFSATVDKRTGVVALLATGFQLRRDPDDDYWRR